jgi:hypothetical protein
MEASANMADSQQSSNDGVGIGAIHSTPPIRCIFTPQDLENFTKSETYGVTNPFLLSAFADFSSS